MIENTHKPNLTGYSPEPRSFLTILGQGLIHDVAMLLVALTIGTMGTAIACWHHGLPLTFSLAGGILILGLALGALLVAKSDSLFS